MFMDTSIVIVCGGILSVLSIFSTADQKSSRPEIDTTADSVAGYRPRFLRSIETMDIEPQSTPKPVLRTNVGPHWSLGSAVRRTPCVHLGSPSSSRARLSVSRDVGSRYRSRGMRPASYSNARRRRSRRAASEASTTASPPPRPPIESTRRSRQAARAARPRHAPHAPHHTLRRAVHAVRALPLPLAR